MLVARAPLKFAVLPAALGLAGAAWLVLGGLALPPEIDQFDARLAAVQPRLRPPPGVTASTLGPHLLRALAPGAIALGHPLFDLGSAAEPTLTLQGLSLGAGGKAALVAIGAGPPVWLAVGESRSGVTLRRVDASSALVETVSGDHTLTLGAGHAATAPPLPPSSAADAAAKPPTPPGVQ